MPTSLYNFQYVPLTGRLPGKSFVSQTEQAINGLAQYVYDNSTNYEAVKAIAQKAEEDSSSALEYSEEALDKAQTALETVGRAYIKTTSAVDLDDYYDSELLLILNMESTNLPANITGYLTVMSSDTHDYCMQVYIGIDGSVYKRTATISNDVPTFGAWSETPITLSSLQTILANYTTVDASNIGINAESDNSIAWGNAIGGGEIVSGEQRLVTGDTVYESEYQMEQKVETDIGINDKRITNIEKLLQGNLYDYQTDSTSAYTKSVPSGAMPYAGLEKVGGKTLVWNQLMHDPTMTSTSYWGIILGADIISLTVTSNTLKIEKVNNQSLHIVIGENNPPTIVAGHKYLMVVDMRSNVNKSVNFAIGISYGAQNVTTEFARYASIITATSSDNNGRFGIYIQGSLMNLDDYVEIRNFCGYDLTLMYGYGNEPTTLAEFEALFPASYYPYNAGTLLSAGVTQVVSKDTNNATLQTYSVPAEVQALEGYGWSAGSVYNYIDFERKVFVKNVGRVSFDDLTFGYNPNVQIFSFTMPSDSKAVALGGIQAVSARYININGTSSQWRAQNMVMTVNNGYESNSKFGYIKDSNYTDANALKTSLSGQYLFYELDAPVETDISAYLTDDNLINVEAGGTLTFENQHGDDYQIPVPSEEEYMIDLQEAINNG